MKINEPTPPSTDGAATCAQPSEPPHPSLYEGDTPRWEVGIGFVIFAMAGYVYYYFTQFENEGGTRRINWVLALTYDLGGKWLPVFVLSVLGVFMCKTGYDKYRRWGRWSR